MGAIFSVFQSPFGTFAVAHIVLNGINLRRSHLFVATVNESMFPEGEGIGQFATVVEIETDGAESIGLAADFDMAASADGVGFGF